MYVYMYALLKALYLAKVHKKTLVTYMYSIRRTFAFS